MFSIQLSLINEKKLIGSKKTNLVEIRDECFMFPPPILLDLTNL